MKAKIENELLKLLLKIIYAKCKNEIKKKNCVFAQEIIKEITTYDLMQGNVSKGLLNNKIKCLTS